MIRTGPARRPNAGFTLVEVVISSTLMAVIIASAYLCLHAAVSAQKANDPRVEVTQSARVALALMTADLRHACPLSKESEFIGMQRLLGDIRADNLDFATHNYTPRREGEGDFCAVSYYLDQDAESGQTSLWRRRNPAMALDPLSGGTRAQIARGLRKLQFEYYDGFDWYDTWGDASGRGKEQTSSRTRSNLWGLPEAVRITLWFDAERQSHKASDSETKVGPPLVFQTVVRLELAAAPSASTSGATPAAEPAGSGPAAPAGPPGVGP